MKIKEKVLNGGKRLFKKRMRLIFWWSIFAVIFLSSAYFIAYSKYKDAPQDEEELMEEEMQNYMSALMKVEIRRRMAQNVV